MTDVATALPSLIDKKDAIEIVRDRIGEILAINASSQAALATADDKDQELYTFDTYLERSNPWESTGSLRPIVNVSIDGASYDSAAGNVVQYQKTSARYNIDCIGFGESTEDGEGHVPGDLMAALSAQRCARLVRNILMAGENTYLQLRGTVWKRWPESLQMMMPPPAERSIPHVVAARIVLNVIFNEEAPEVVGEALEVVGVQVLRESDGKVIVQAEYNFGD